MTPEKKKPAGKKPAPKKPAPKKAASSDKTEKLDHTQEYELGDDFLADIDEDELEDEELEGEELESEVEVEDEDEELESEVEDEELDDDEDLEDDEEDELEEIVSAETQEWDPLAEEGTGEEEQTLVASAGARIGEARKKVTSSFESMPGGEKVTSGFRALLRWRPKGFPIWARFTTASFLIVISVATATSASLILYLGDIASALRHGSALEGVDKFLTRVPSSGPQTILILGSDKRPEDKGTSFKGLSDTTMLLRLDPDRNAIALFSLPRDLKVSIPGVGEDKLNAAYAYGGPKLTLQTIQQLTGLQINHLVNVDFEGFARAVNALDCVYVDVDRRYFNQNTPGADLTNYEEIDLQPGYQALCGFDALDYARYRHTDNDVVRAARQQEFLREARQKIPPERLFQDRKELISIFTEHTSSDINNPQTMLQVLKLFLDARNAPLKQVRFEGTLGPSFVTATSQEIHKAVNQFLGFQASPAGRESAAPPNPVKPDVAPDQSAPVPAAPRGKKGPLPPPPEPSNDGSTDDSFSISETSYGRELARRMRKRVAKLPVFYPTVLETGSDFAQKPRVYKVNGTGEGSPPAGERAAYKWVFSRPALGEYYGFEATRWKNPPILADPDATKEIGDREYKIFYDGDRVRILAWSDDRGTYWLSNTLIESLSDREMVKIAEGFRELPAPGG